MGLMTDEQKRIHVLSTGRWTGNYNKKFTAKHIEQNRNKKAMVRRSFNIFGRPGQTACDAQVRLSGSGSRFILSHSSLWSEPLLWSSRRSPVPRLAQPVHLAYLPCVLSSNFYSRSHIIIYGFVRSTNYLYCPPTWPLFCRQIRYHQLRRVDRS